MVEDRLEGVFKTGSSRDLELLVELSAGEAGDVLQMSARDQFFLVEVEELSQKRLKVVLGLAEDLLEGLHSMEGLKTQRKVLGVAVLLFGPGLFLFVRSVDYRRLVKDLTKQVLLQLALGSKVRLQLLFLGRDVYPLLLELFFPLKVFLLLFFCLPGTVLDCCGNSSFAEDFEVLLFEGTCRWEFDVFGHVFRVFESRLVERESVLRLALKDLLLEMLRWEVISAVEGEGLWEDVVLG